MNRPLRIAMIVVAPALAEAQAPRSAATLTASEVAQIQADLKSDFDRNDAAAWHRAGMQAWSLAIRADTDPRLKNLDPTRLRRQADTSLRTAAQLAPANAQYQLDAGSFLRSAEEAAARLAAVPFFDKALEIARAGNDSALHALTALEAGRVRWLRYDIVPSRMPPCEKLSTNVDSASIQGQSRPRLPSEYAFKFLHNQLSDCFGSVRIFDNADYVTSEQLFREARAFAPRDGRAFRHIAMLLSERKRWQELEALALDRMRAGSPDAESWLALGLALQRSGRSGRALAAFDSGASKLSDRERGRLFALTRLMGPPDSVAYARSASAERRSHESTFWGLISPLWSRPENDPRAEFMARVEFAELRWTVDELGVRGADSDRGEILIRYGHPDRTYSLRGCDFWPTNPPSPPPVEPPGCNPLIAAAPGRGTQRPGLADVVTYWDYDNGLTLVFYGAPTYGTAHFPASDLSHVAAAVELRSASFDNIARERIIDLPVRTARFRASTDSVDLLMMLGAPVDSIRAASTIASTPRLDLWITPREAGSGRTLRDSAMVRGSGVGRFMYRLPATQYYYRLEATAEGSMTAARAMGWLTAGLDSTSGFATRGFGMSDLLLASEARANASTPQRWTDFGIAPLLGSIERGRTLHLIWENYELAPRDGNADYTIEVVIERQHGTLDRIASNIIGAIANAIGVQRDANRVSYTFERTTTAAPAIVDFVTLNLGTTPPGDYRLNVAVTDKNSGRKVFMSSMFTIRE